MSKIPIVYSPGFGAGWYSWNKEYPQCLSDKTLVSMIVNHKPAHEIEAYAKEQWPDGYWSADTFGLCVEWVEEGTKFKIEEYDGSESVLLEEDAGWLVAGVDARYW